MRTASLLCLPAAALLTSLAAPAAADTDRRDPLLYAGAGATAVAAGALTTGALVAGLGRGPEHCGITGCVVWRNPDTRRIGGALLGAGAGAAVIGVPALLAGLSAPPDPGVRTSEPRMVAGLALTEVGVALVGASVGLMVADKGAWHGASTGPMAVVFMAGGIGAAAVGVPLWATGQAKKGPRSPAVLHPAPPPPPPPSDSGTGLRAAGITLTLAGVAGIVGGIASMTFADTRGDFGGYNLLPGIIALGMGNIVASVGIPLWIVGQNKVSAAKAANEANAGSQPSWALRAGGTGLWLEGRY